MASGRRSSLFFATLISTTNLAFAGTGIYTTGYGTQEQGMGGAGIAVGESALAPAENPAGIAFSGDRLDTGGAIGFIRAGSQDNGVTYAGKTTIAPMPEFGYVHAFSSSIVFGVASWTSGSEIDYGTPYGHIPGNSNTYGEGLFVHVAPTVAFRFGPGNNTALSFAVVGALSTVKSDGVEAQTGFPNQGRDWAPGYGFKVGWMSKLTSNLSVGAFYASPIHYESWSAYSHIFPDGARFEEPEQYGAGIAFRPISRVLLAFDWVRFNYGSTSVLGNPISFTAQPGSPDGPGFGYGNVNAYRFGVQFDATSALTLRAGFEIADEPITPSNTALTFLIPSTPNRTYTVGATYRFGKASELSVSYALSPRVQVNGTGLSTGTNPYGNGNFAALTYTRKY
jgi:long-chain fatty acid transport protein